MTVMPAASLDTVAPRDSGDPYLLTPYAIEAPPTSIAASLRRVGPGMVLAAAIVGSGELIATTTLGAQVGFAALWIILVSCAIKPVVQAELGRYTIATGHTGLEGTGAVGAPAADRHRLLIPATHPPARRYPPVDGHHRHAVDRDSGDDGIRALLCRGASRVL